MASNEPMRRLAVMKNVHFGVGDRGTVCMWFEAYASENRCALQVLSVEQAVELLQAHGVDNVHRLEGKTCWVDEGDGLILYRGPAKL